MTSSANTLRDFLYSGIIDEIVEAQTIWIREFKFVVVDQKPKQDEWLKILLAAFRILHNLSKIKRDS